MKNQRFFVLAMVASAAGGGSSFDDVKTSTICRKRRLASGKLWRNSMENEIKNPEQNTEESIPETLKEKESEAVSDITSAEKSADSSMESTEKSMVDPESSSADVEEPAKKKESIVRSILSWVVTIAIGVGLALLVNSFILINAQVISGSMKDTLQIGDRIMGTRFSYWFSEPQRGDIVIFKYGIEEALGKEEDYIKRIIGLPGEKIEIRQGKVYINDSETPLDEPYLKETWTRKNDGMTFVVPEGCYFVMGDNRNNSKDSRYWADEAIKYGLAQTQEEAEAFSYVSKDKILGKVYFCYWPFAQLKWYSNPDYAG